MLQFLPEKLVFTRMTKLSKGTREFIKNKISYIKPTGTSFTLKSRSLQKLPVCTRSGFTAIPSLLSFFDEISLEVDSSNTIGELKSALLSIRKHNFNATLRFSFFQVKFEEHYMLNAVLNGMRVKRVRLVQCDDFKLHQIIEKAEELDIE